MRIVTALMLLCLSTTAVAQTKKPAATTLDVDRLYAKYKDYQTVTIHTPDGDLTANVQIELNDAGKPYAVILYGWQLFGDVNLNRLKESLESSKEKAGYKHMGITSLRFKGEYVMRASLYQKGTQYAKYGIEDQSMRNLGLFTTEPKKPLGDFFYFEVGDVRRRTNGKTEKFEF